MAHNIFESVETVTGKYKSQTEVGYFQASPDRKQEATSESQHDYYQFAQVLVENAAPSDSEVLEQDR
jgi:hypothetical protein